MAYATLVQMAALRPGGIDSADEDRAEAILDEVSWLIEEAAGKVYEDPEDAPKAWMSVCRTAALRIFDNPDAFTMEQVAAGYMNQRSSETVTGFELTKREAARVRKAAGLYAVGSIVTPLGYDDTNLISITAADKAE